MVAEYYSVTKILQNRVYYGVVVGHKREAIVLCSSHTVSVSEGEQRFKKQNPQKDDRRYNKERPLVCGGKTICGMAKKDKEKCETDRFSNVDRFMVGELEKVITVW